MLNVHDAAAAAYGALDARLVDPTRAEALIFAKVTRRLEAVFANPETTHAARATVLHDNRRLWFAAAAATADDGNTLTDEARAGIINLAGFIDRHTRAVLKGTGDPAILSEINRRVSGGLSHGAR